jgi:gamma-glutamyltranspeptidase/glutathione hydrolase
MSGIIAAGGKITTEAGRAVLKAGGNAVDAAVSAAFASFIAEFGVSHLGGSGFAVVFDPFTNKKVVYDFYSSMPSIGLSEFPNSLDFKPVSIGFGPTSQDFYLGRASVAVPGNIFGLCELANDLGNLALPNLLETAINLAETNLELPKFQIDACELQSPFFSHTSSLRHVYNQVKTTGQVFIPRLYNTLTTLSEQGSSFLRTGYLGEKLVNDQRVNGGLITHADLQHYEVKHINPLQIRYREYEVILPPLSSIGGVLIAFSLKLLHHFDVAKWPLGSVEAYLIIFEILQATTRARIKLERALRKEPESYLEVINKFLEDNFVSRYVMEVEASLKNQNHYNVEYSSKFKHNNTTHISVIDGKGMAVALTTTPGNCAGHIVPDTGLILNNILGEADLNPYGWHQWRPGARITSMMSPVILLKDGQVKLITGSGGSERIRSAILQVISNYVDHKLSLAKSVELPRIHVEKNTLQFEKGYDRGSVEILEQKGYPIRRWDRRSLYFGGAHSVAVEAENSLIGKGDSRRDGYVLACG